MLLRNLTRGRRSGRGVNARENGGVKGRESRHHRGCHAARYPGRFAGPGRAARQPDLVLCTSENQLAGRAPRASNAARGSARHASGERRRRAPAHRSWSWFPTAPRRSCLVSPDHAGPNRSEAASPTGSRIHPGRSVALRQGAVGWLRSHFAWLGPPADRVRARLEFFLWVQPIASRAFHIAPILTRRPLCASQASMRSTKRASGNASACFAIQARSTDRRRSPPRFFGSTSPVSRARRKSRLTLALPTSNISAVSS